MIDDAIRSLHALFFTSLLVLLLWLLAWPAATEKIRLYHATAEVTAWAAAREALAGMHRSVFAEPPDTDIAEDEMLGEPQAPSNEPEDIRFALEATITWPDERTEPFTLVHAEQFNPRMMTLTGTAARVYRIVTEHGDLPFHNHYAVFVQDTVPTLENGDVVEKPRTRIGIVPATFPQFKMRGAGTRQADLALQRADVPDRWSEVRLALRRLGYAGAPEELSTSDAALARLQSEEDPRLRSGGVTVFGAQLSLAQFFSSVGLLLAGVAFSMIGPLIALRSASFVTHGQSWVFVVPARGSLGRRLLDCVASVFTAAWAVSPIVILVLQRRSAADLQGLTNDRLFSLGAVGLVFSAVVFAMVTIDLWRIRNAPVAKPQPLHPAAV